MTRRFDSPGRYGNGGRNADEDEQRRHQEPAAYAEDPGQESNAATETQQDQRVDRDLGDRKIDVHERIP
jgi:hypothetical protein